MSALSAFQVLPPSHLLCNSTSDKHRPGNRGWPQNPCPGSLLWSLRACSWDSRLHVQVGGVTQQGSDLGRATTPVQGHKQQCQQKEGKGLWLGCHRALAKPPITPLSMIGPKNHRSKLGALENPHIFKNKPHPAKSSKGQKEDLEGNEEIFRADRKWHSDTLNSVGCRGDFTASGD